MANRNRSVEKEAFWRGVLSRQRASGLSVRRFCLREEISEASFYAWRREILRRDADSEEVVESREGAKGSGRGLVPVDVVPANAVLPSLAARRASDSVAAQMLEIVTPEGLTLRFAPETAVETVAALVEVIAPRLDAGRHQRRDAC